MPVPYDAVGALQARGVVLELAACQAYGMSEDTRVYNVLAEGHAPFALMVARREAPTANANSHYNVAVDLSGLPASLQRLRANGDEWAASCPF
jgi:hypothetical protein